MTGYISRIRLWWGVVGAAVVIAGVLPFVAGQRETRRPEGRVAPESVPWGHGPHVSSVCAGRPASIIDWGVHTGTIFWLSFTPDGRYLLSAGRDETIRVWDVRQRERPRLVRTLRLEIGTGWQGALYSCALSPDGTLLATGGHGFEDDRGLITLIDWQHAEVLGVLRGHASSVFSLTFSPNGKWIASGGADRMVRLWWAPGNGQSTSMWACAATLAGHRRSITSLAWAPDGRQFVSASRDNTLRTWRIEKGRWRQGVVLPMPSEAAMTPDPTADLVAWSPNGRYLAAGGRGSRLSIWNIRRRRPLKVLTEFPSALVFGSDSNLVIGCTHFSRRVQSRCLVWSVSEDREVRSFRKDAGSASAIALSSDGRQVATGGFGSNDIQIWDAQTTDMVANIQALVPEPYDLRFSPDGSSCQWVCTEYREAPDTTDPCRAYMQVTFDLPNGKLDSLERRPPFGMPWAGPRRRAGGVRVRRWTRDGRTTTDIIDDLPWYDITTDPNESAVVLREFPYFLEPHYDLAPDGKSVALGAGQHGYHDPRATASDYSIALHDTRTGSAIRTFAEEGTPVYDLRISSDGKLLLAILGDRTFGLWNIETGERLTTVFVSPAGEGIAWTPQGYYASSKNGDKLLGWHLNRGRDRLARTVYAWQIRHRFHRPDILRRIYQTRNVEQAVRLANAEASREPAARATIRELAKRLPPEVKLHEPAYDAEVIGPVVRVRATVASDLPLTKVVVLLNEGPAHVLRQPAVDVFVTLEVGENEVTVQAENTAGISQPAWARVWYRPPGHSRD